MIDLKIFNKILGRFSKKEKRIFYITFCLAVVFLVERLVLHPIFSKLKSMDEEIHKNEQGIRRSLQILSQKEDILSERKKYSHLIEGDVSEEEEAVSILKEIEGIANKSSVYLVDLKPAGLKKADNMSKYIVNLNLEAQMEQLVNFMYEVEASGKWLSIEKYEILPKSKDSSIAKCNLVVSKRVMAKAKTQGNAR